MIDEKILKIAANNKYYGLKNAYTHKSNCKNKKCGDRIKIELIITNNNLKDMRYVTESCIFCEASASILAHKIKYFTVSELITNINEIKKKIKKKNYSIPSKLNQFKYLLNKNNLPRIDCVMLPMEGIVKAINT